MTDKTPLEQWKDRVCIVCSNAFTAGRNSRKKRICSEECRQMRDGDRRKLIRWIENWEPALIAKLATPCYDCISHKPTADGYLMICKYHIYIRMHRFIYEEMFGAIEDNLIVLHDCDNRKCINPEHLRVGTFADNNNDRNKRGRTRNQYTGTRENPINYIPKRKYYVKRRSIATMA